MSRIGQLIISVNNVKGAKVPNTKNAIPVYLTNDSVNADTVHAEKDAPHVYIMNDVDGIEKPNVKRNAAPLAYDLAEKGVIVTSDIKNAIPIYVVNRPASHVWEDETKAVWRNEKNETWENE